MVVRNDEVDPQIKNEIVKEVEGSYLQMVHCKDAFVYQYLDSDGSDVIVGNIFNKEEVLHRHSVDQ